MRNYRNAALRKGFAGLDGRRSWAATRITGVAAWAPGKLRLCREPGSGIVFGA